MHHHCFVTAALFSLAALGCGDSEGAPASSMPAPESDAPSAAAFAFAVDGRSEAMWGQAVFHVVEGTLEVDLNITGGDSDDNLVVIDVIFEGLDSIIGVHPLRLGLPDDVNADASLIASFDGQVFYPQLGQLDLSLSAGRKIEGHFDTTLLQAVPEAQRGVAPRFEPDAVVLPSRGEFSGSWGVDCVSPLIGFTGGHVISDSAYCRGLDL